MSDIREFKKRHIEICLNCDAQSLVSVAKELPYKTIIASGGIRNGLDIAKAIALGADAGGYCLPIPDASQFLCSCGGESLGAFYRGA